MIVGVHANVDLCTEKGSKVCSAAGSVAKYTAFAAGTVALTVGTGGAGDIAEGAALANDTREGSEALEGADALADAGDGAESDSEAAQTSCPIAGNSFPGGTGVMLADGKPQAISTLKVGDLLLSLDRSTGRNVAAAVTGTYAHSDHQLTDLALRVTPAGKAGRAGSATLVKPGNAVKHAVLHTTAGHLVYDQTARGWVTAARIRAGDALTSLDGSTITVERVRTWTHAAWMYDLTINATHTFYTLAAGSTTPLLVHNCQAGDLNTNQARSRIASHIQSLHGAGTTSTGSKFLESESTDEDILNNLYETLDRTGSDETGDHIQELDMVDRWEVAAKLESACACMRTASSGQPIR